MSPRLKTLLLIAAPLLMAAEAPPPCARPSVPAGKQVPAPLDLAGRPLEPGLLTPPSLALPSTMGSAAIACADTALSGAAERDVRNDILHALPPAGLLPPQPAPLGKPRASGP